MALVINHQRDAMKVFSHNGGHAEAVGKPAAPKPSMGDAKADAGFKDLMAKAAPAQAAQASAAAGVTTATAEPSFDRSTMSLASSASPK
jgi:hypothetical protein